MHVKEINMQDQTFERYLFELINGMGTHHSAPDIDIIDNSPPKSHHDYEKAYIVTYRNYCFVVALQVDKIAHDKGEVTEAVNYLFSSTFNDEYTPISAKDALLMIERLVNPPAVEPKGIKLTADIRKATQRAYEYAKMSHRASIAYEALHKLKNYAIEDAITEDELTVLLKAIDICGKVADAHVEQQAFKSLANK